MNDKQRVRDTKQQHNYLSAIAASAYSRRLATNEIINTAYDWVYAQRKNHSHNNSIWSLRANWAQLKPQLISQLLSGSYRLSPLKSHTINGERVSSWEAMDALVLKALALTLSPLFSPEEYSHCTHLKGGGGIHGAVKEVSRQRPGYKYILKSDVYHYYESIDHNVLLQALAKEVNCSIILDLVTQYCQRLEVHDGLYYHFTRGIPKGCPISPLMAALYLKPLDEEMKRHRFYVRFMDD